MRWLSQTAPVQLTSSSSIFVMIRMQTASKVFRRTTSDKASPLNQINVRAECYSQGEIFYNCINITGTDVEITHESRRVV